MLTAAAAASLDGQLTREPTGGPWVVDRHEAERGYPAELFVRDTNPQDHPQGPYTVATVNQSYGKESEANARLIAAAPELLELAKIILARLDAEAVDLASRGKPLVFINAGWREDLRRVIDTV